VAEWMKPQYGSQLTKRSNLFRTPCRNWRRGLLCRRKKGKTLFVRDTPRRQAYSETRRDSATMH
jgi:hypothetical protein